MRFENRPSAPLKKVRAAPFDTNRLFLQVATLCWAAVATCSVVSAVLSDINTAYVRQHAGIRCEHAFDVNHDMLCSARRSSNSPSMFPSARTHLGALWLALQP